MAKYTLNLRASRPARARLGKIYDKSWLITTCKLVVFGSVVIGVGLLIINDPVGWLALLPGAIAYLLVAWVAGDLSDKSVPKKADFKLHNLLDFYPLSRLKNDSPSAYELWQALEGCEESYFVSNRFLIDKNFFEQLLDKSPGSAEKIWPIAEKYRAKYQLDCLSNTIVLVSLIVSVPNHEQILKTIQLDVEDVESAIPWMTDILEKRRLAKSKQFFGGIGRDWAYGYTPILQSLGHNISQNIEMHGFFRDTSMHEKLVGQMIQMMNNGNGTVTLIGDTGVGKTTCVHAFAEHILGDKTTPKNILHNQVVELDAPTLLSQAKKPGELEALMIQIFNEALRAKNIILFFDDAEAFFGTGTGTVDLSHVLRPALESSSVRVVLAMSPVAWQRLNGTGATGKMQPLNVAPADENTTLAVLRDSISATEYKNKVVFTYQALREGYKLGSRYVNNLAMPGAALSVLEQTATTANQQLVTKEMVQASVEQAYGIKLQATSQSESNQLLNLETELHKYVINQDRAVTVVADALRRARSGVGNPNRPVGTFLFLGPTGVGKTELSKALARTYFGNEKALIRLDMNQFVGPEDVSRLIEVSRGQELGFLGKVRKQPFSVILLDEVEKAHSSVVNAFLQTLDEGEMRDSDNKAVSFKDAIIIATSNAGADEIRKIIDSGDNIDDREAEFIETLISRGLFAPELINRFDEIVIFKPLKPDELVQVIDIIVAGINKSLDSQKVQVELTLPAKKWLVAKGYDSKLGARPMRRMAQRYVENTVAKKLLDKSVTSGEKILLDVRDFENQK